MSPSQLDSEHELNCKRRQGHRDRTLRRVTESMCAGHSANPYSHTDRWQKQPSSTDLHTECKINRNARSRKSTAVANDKVRIFWA